MVPGKRKNFEDITGFIFGDLLVLEYAGRKSTPSGSFKSEWRCKCSCGKEVFATTPKLRSGSKNSCGCKTKDRMSVANSKHGMHARPEYTAWAGLKSRTTNPGNKDFPDYGGRGIILCERWASFENFFEDMGPRPGKGYSIDRINVNGPYSPENCRWATTETQCNNKRNTTFITAQGVTKPITEWARDLGCHPNVIRVRIDRFSWPAEDAVTKPVAFRKPRASKEWPCQPPDLPPGPTSGC